MKEGRQFNHFHIFPLTHPSAINNTYLLILFFMGVLDDLQYKLKQYSHYPLFTHKIQVFKSHSVEQGPFSF